MGAITATSSSSTRPWTYWKYWGRAADDTTEVRLHVAMEEAEEKEAMRSLNEAPAEEGDAGPTTIGELIKAQMEGRE